MGSLRLPTAWLRFARVLGEKRTKDLPRWPRAFPTTGRASTTVPRPERFSRRRRRLGREPFGSPPSSSRRPDTTDRELESCHRFVSLGRRRRRRVTLEIREHVVDTSHALTFGVRLL